MNAKILHQDDLPDILSAQHIADYLGISRRVVYELFDQPVRLGGIRNFRVGVGQKRPSRRVLRTDFINWLERKMKDQDQTVNRRFELIEGSVKHG